MMTCFKHKRGGMGASMWAEECAGCIYNDLTAATAQRDELAKLLREWMDIAQAKKDKRGEWCDECAGIGDCPCRRTRAALAKLDAEKERGK